MKVSAVTRGAVFVLLAAPAVLRGLIVIASNPFFSIDPRLLPVPLEGLGPAGSTALDALALLGCLLALGAEVVDRRGVDLKLLLLFLLPIPVLAWHGWNDAEQMRVGSQWIGAMATAVGAAHLAREVRWRILLLGAAVALTIPLAIKGVYQVTIEYGDTLRSFEQNKTTLLESQGWEPGSSAAEIYFRRLTQREATGWLSLSNVYGSLMAMLATFWVGAALAVARSKLQSGWLGIVIIAAAAALAGLTVSFSKGAVAAAVIGLVLAAMCLMPRRWKQHLRPHTATLTVGLIALALVVTALRGMLFPDSLQSADGYSLLFRWQYWTGAARMFAAHPFTGVGPGGFQNAYLLARPLLSPEEVASPHSVYIDWLAGGGLLGAAWVVLTLVLLRRAAPLAATSERSSTEPADAAATAALADSKPHEHGMTAAPSTKLVWVCSISLALLSGGAAWFLNRRAFFIDYDVLLMPLSLIGMATTVALVAFIVRHVSLGLLRWAVWAALTVVLLHSQIEMTMTQPGSAAIVMLLLGTASGKLNPAAEHRARRGSPPAMLALVVVAAVVAGHLVAVVLPTARIQSHLRTAHAALESIGSVRTALSQARGTRDLNERLGHLQRAESQLQRVGESVDLQGTWREIQSAVRLNDGPRVQRLVSTGATALDEALSRLEVDKVAAALTEFEQARRLRPLDEIAWREASRLWMHLATLHDSRGDTANRDEAAAIACQLAEQFADDRPEEANAAAMAARRWYERRQFTPDAVSLDKAIEWQQRVVALDPNGLDSRRTLAQMLDEAARTSEALAAYQRTLEINDNMRLDPLKQLSPSQLVRVRSRIEALSGG